MGTNNAKAIKPSVETKKRFFVTNKMKGSIINETKLQVDKIKNNEGKVRKHVIFENLSH